MKTIQPALVSLFLLSGMSLVALGVAQAQELAELEAMPLEEAELEGEAVLEPVNLADYILTQEELREQQLRTQGMENAQRGGEAASASLAEKSEDGLAQKEQLQPPHIVLVVGKNHSALAASPYLEATQSWLAPAEQYASLSPFLSQLASAGVQFDSAWSTGWDKGGAYQGLLSGFHPVSARAGSVSLASELRELGYQTAAFGHWAEQVLPSARGFTYWEITQGEERLLNPVYAGSQGRRIERGHETVLTADKLIDWLAGQELQSNKQPVFVLCQFESPGQWPLGTAEQSGFWGPELLMDAQQSWQWHPGIPWQAPQLDEQVDARQKGRFFGEAQAVKLGAEFAAQGHGYYRASLNDRWPDVMERVASASEQRAYFSHLMRANSLRRQAQASGFSLLDEDLQRWQQQRYLREYLAAVRSVDFALSRIAQALDEEGILENTLLIYTGAQGTELGEVGWIGGVLAGREAGLRVPMVWHWPRVLPAGKVVKTPVQTVDLAATLLPIVREQSRASQADNASVVAAAAGRDPTLYEQETGAGSSLLPLVFEAAGAERLKQRSLYFSDLGQRAGEGALVDGEFRLFPATESEALDESEQEFWSSLRQTWSQ